jgi:SET domain-containing protein
VRRDTGTVTSASAPRDVWLDERLIVRSSPIEGQGLFAAEAVPAGTVVVGLGGRVVSSAELDSLIAAADADPAAPYVDTLTVDEDLHLVLPSMTSVHFVNHSCDPTLWHVGPYEVATRRALDPGDEATIDYGTNSGARGFVMACRCQSALCRGRISSDDWRRPELQERYRGHWVPALQLRIDST